jgi:hypothetical protein
MILEQGNATGVIRRELWEGIARRGDGARGAILHRLLRGVERPHPSVVPTSPISATGITDFSERNVMVSIGVGLHDKTPRDEKSSNVLGKCGCGVAAGILRST